MPSNPRALPQAPTDVDSALALVCPLPPTARDGRRTDVQSVVTQSSAFRELETGVAFSFPDTDDMGHTLLELILAERNCCARFNYTMTFTAANQTIELRVDAPPSLVQPLKELYLGLARDAGVNAEH